LFSLLWVYLMETLIVLEFYNSLEQHPLPTSTIVVFSLYNNPQQKQNSSFSTNFNVYCKKWHLEFCSIDLNTHLYKNRNENIY
jgi:hypothetical protein